MITSSYLVKGQRKFMLVVKSQSKYLAGQHFDRGRRSEYRIYRSVTPLTSHAEAAIYLAINDPSSAKSGSEASNLYNLTIPPLLNLVLKHRICTISPGAPEGSLTLQERPKT